MHAKSANLRFALIATFFGVFGFLGGQWASAEMPLQRLFPLISTSTTATGEAITYPTSGPAAVSAFILTLQPGEETGWHKHNVPGFGFMLEGEATVDYQGHGTRTYKAGEALIETVGVAHNGRNSGTGPLRILAVFMGADGIKTTEPAASR